MASTRRGVDATRRRVDLRDATRRRGRARARDVDVLSVNVLRVSRNGRYVGVRCKGYRLEGSGTGSDPPDLETPEGRGRCARARYPPRPDFRGYNRKKFRLRRVKTA